MGFAWRRLRVAGSAAVLGSAVLSVFACVTAGLNRGAAMAVSGGPFVVAVPLFLASGLRSARRAEV